MPPAIAGPSTAAISGLVSRQPLSSDLITDGSNAPDSKLSPGCDCVIALRSAPAQKAPPAPVRIADPDVRVVVDPVPGLAHDREHLPGQRVARLGPVHGDDEHVVALLDERVRLLAASAARSCAFLSASGPDASPKQEHVLVSAHGPEHRRPLRACRRRGPRRAARRPAATDSVTYAELEARANRLAHYLAAHGRRRRATTSASTRRTAIEHVETLLAVFKIRAVAINVNYRYVAGELHYLFDNADLVALVHERTYAPLVAAAPPDAPSCAARGRDRRRLRRAR